MVRERVKRVEPWLAFMFSFFASSLAGLSYSLEKYYCFAKSLQSVVAGGCFGLGVTLLLWGKFGDTPAGVYGMIGVSMLLTAAGFNAVDLLPLLKRIFLARVGLEDKDGDPPKGKGTARDRRKPDSDAAGKGTGP